MCGCATDVRGNGFSDAEMHEAKAPCDFSVVILKCAGIFFCVLQPIQMNRLLAHRDMQRCEPSLKLNSGKTLNAVYRQIFSCYDLQ